MVESVSSGLKVLAACVALGGGYVGLVEAPDRRPDWEQTADRFVQAWLTRDFPELTETATEPIQQRARESYLLGVLFGQVSIGVSPVRVKFPVLNILGVTRLDTFTVRHTGNLVVVVEGRVKTSLSGSQATEVMCVGVGLRRTDTGFVVDRVYDAKRPNRDVEAWNIGEVQVQ